MTDACRDHLPPGILRRLNSVVDRGHHEELRWRLRQRREALREASRRVQAGAAGGLPFAHATATEDPRIVQFGGYRTSAQRLQDVFVRIMAAKSGLSSCLEIGGADPVNLSNTYLLESEEGWSGVSVELDPELAGRHSGVRRSPCLVLDATVADYAEILASHLGEGDVGYLSLDIDPAHQSLNALAQLPLQDRRFAVVTFEHDAYRVGRGVRGVSRQILNHFGYELVVADAKNDGLSFEDWWVHPALVPHETWAQYQADHVDPAELLWEKRSSWAF